MSSKRFLSILLTVIVLISALSFNSFAETLDSSTFDYKCTQFYQDGTSNNITDDITVSEFTEDEGERIVRFSMPGDSNLEFQLLVVYSLSNLKVGHEYEMSFGYALGHGPSASEFVVNLVFYDGNGNVIKTQELYKNAPNFINEIKHLNLSFIPDSSGVTSGYYTELQFKFYSNTVYSNTAKLTKEITVKDTNDNMGLIEGIIDWVKHIYYGLVGGTCDCGKAYDGVVQGIKNGLVSLGNTISNALNTIKEDLVNTINNVRDWLADVKQGIVNAINNIKNWLEDLGNSIADGLTALKNYILYFQHPVTINSDGVPIGKDGKPVYENPFSKKFAEIHKTLSEWLEKLHSFVDSINLSSQNVSEYLKTFTNAFERFGKGAPVFLIVISFGFLLIVIKKVVGR